MECQSKIKNLKINKNKTVGTIVVVVEGEEERQIGLSCSFRCP